MDVTTFNYKMMKKQLEKEVKLTELQDKAFTLMRNGKSIFLTGPGGVGKTKTLQMFMKIYKYHKNMGVTSTTGVSALLFGGSTLHSFTGIGLGTGSVESIVAKIYKKKYLLKRWRELELLIIDEVSMLSPVLFDKLEHIARIVRGSKLPFGGVQLILSGDFCQLPVINSEDFCFESKTWDKCLDETIYLTKIIRQSDPIFQKCLNEVRLGILSTQTKKILKSRIGVEIVNEFGIKPTKLYSTNRDVSYINNQELDKLAENGAEFREYEMNLQIYPGSGNIQYMKEKYRKNCMAEDVLQLCVGAQVMLLHNLDIESGLVNGSRGIVTEFIEDFPKVKFLNGKEILIADHIWEWEESDKKLGRIIQIPLKVAFAITIHKIQGSSLDCVEMDLGNIFEFGQAYVALSRVRNLEGLSIIDIDYDKIAAHPKALKYYKELVK